MHLITAVHFHGPVQVSVIFVSVGSAVNPVGGEEAVEREQLLRYYNSICLRVR